MKFMRIVHIIESIESSYGGPALSLPKFVNALNENKKNSEIWSISSDGKFSNSLLSSLEVSVKLHKKNLFKYFSLGLILGVLKSCIKRDVDLFHFHSVWSSPTWFGMFICNVFNIPYVLSPRSSLYVDSLKKKKALKVIIGFIFLKRLLKKCEFIHCTDLKEKQDVLKYCACSTVIIPHGVDINKKVVEISDKVVFDFYSEFQLGEYNLLYCSRIHPRKNLLIAVESFVDSNLPNSGWKFFVAGPIDDYDYYQKVVDYIGEKNVHECVVFVGMIEDPIKTLFYRLSDAFILLSDFENFGMSISEALVENTYTIISENTPWKNLHKYGVGATCALNSKVVSKELSFFSESIKGDCPVALDFEGYLNNYVISWDEVAKIFIREYGRIA
jgi:glycosyltransferase involved in cell wall biosynthesis